MANTLDLFRTGDVGFIDWLDDWHITEDGGHEAHRADGWRSDVKLDESRKHPPLFPSIVNSIPRDQQRRLTKPESGPDGDVKSFVRRVDRQAACV